MADTTDTTVTKPVVEILSFPTSAAFQRDPASTGASGLALLDDAEGCLGAYYGLQVEDPKVGYLFVVWKSYEHHMAWTANPSYALAMKCLRKCSTGKYNFQHVNFTESTKNALGAPATELLTLKLKPNGSKKKLTAALTGLSGQVNALEDTHSPSTWGGSREYPGRYTFIAGWSSKKAHDRVQSASGDSPFLKILQEEADVALVHVRFHIHSSRVLAVL